MAIDLHPYTCNGCGKKRESDVNRWWLLWLAEVVAGEVDGMRIPALDHVLALRAWDDGWAKHEKVFHLCGQACVQKKVEGWLSTGRLE